MNKDIIIVGASGFGSETAYLIEELDEYNILGFIDDNINILGNKVLDYEVLGNTDDLLTYDKEVNVALSIANPAIRKKLIYKLKSNKNLSFPNIIAQNVRIHKSINLGEGNIICQGTSLTVNISIGNFNHINPNSTIGHDTVLYDYVTIYPGCNVSGNVTLNDQVELGTGSKIIQGKHIVDKAVIGAGSVIIKNIEETGVYVGVPVKKVK